MPAECRHAAEGRFSLCPLGIRSQHHGRGDGLVLTNGPYCFDLCEVTWRVPGRPPEQAVLPAGEVLAWAGERGAGDQAEALLALLTAARAPLCGLDLARPRIMGILNVTPDSFSDGGDRFDPERAIADGLAMMEAGADILDVGGESTRPGAAPVPRDDEIQRVVPVIKALSTAGALVSIDSRHAPVMAAAIEAGARIINDVTALTGDPQSLRLAADAGVPVILMHMQGEPQTMQRNPSYDDAALDIFDYLAARIALCEEAGLPRERIVVDPGIGFGKNLDHNLRVLEQMAVYHGLGCPVMLGASRKSFIGRLAPGAAAPKQRMPGSLAVALSAVARGVQLLRVHDVAETRQAVAVWQAVEEAAGNP